MKRKLLFYYTNSKSFIVTTMLLLTSTISFAQNVNIAPLATASASTCFNAACSSLNDLNYGNCGTLQVWINANATNPGSAIYIQFNWSLPQVIRGITVHAGESGNSFLAGGTIQAWNGSAWVTATTFTQSNINVCNYNVNFFPVLTNQLRIIDLVVAGSQSINVKLREIEIWQGSMANDDIGVAAIDSPTTFCNSTQNIVARVVNYGKNQVTGFNVNWSLNGVTQTPITSTTLLDTAGGAGSNNTQVLLGSYTFPNNVITQIKAWTSNPNNTNDTILTNDTATTNKSIGMSGTYTIGATGTYLTINDAVADLKIKGICGPVIFNVTNATYTGPVVIDGVIAGTSATNTIRFNGNGATITGTTSPLMSLNNVSYITIDSFNIFGATGFAGTGVHVTNQCRNITFDANIINVGITSTSTSNIGFAASGSPIGATTIGNNAQYITFINNTVIGGYYSATFIGNPGYASNFGHYIANNTFRDFYLYGVYFLHADSTVLLSNDINRATRTSLSTLYGIYLSTSRFVKIQKNKLHDFGAASYSAYPICIINSVNSAGFETEISNNTIYNIGQTAGIFYGIYSLTTALNRVNIYHNTIAYSVPTASTSEIRGMFFSVALTNVNVRNNIINITGGGAGDKTGIYVTTTSTSFVSNNNNIIVATTASNYVGYWIVGRVTLANWQTASGQDLNSNDINPQFTNLSLGNLKPLSIQLDNLGFAVGVLTDITGTTRSLATPDAGAYEFTGLSVDISVVSGSLKRSSDCYANVDSVFITVRNLIGSTVDFNINPLTVKWVSNGPVNSNGNITIFSGTLSPNADTTVWANNVDISLPGTYNLTVFIEPNTVNASRLNDTLFNAASLIVRPILSVTQRNFTVTGPNDTIVAQATSPILPGGSIFFSEVCHWRGSVGTGWPAYLIADDYVEISGVPNTDLSGYILEEWTGTTLQHTYTFPTGSLFSPNGTMIVATGQLGSSVPSPSNFYYHSGNTVTHSSTGDLRGYVIKSPAGTTVIDAVTYGAYTFPAASNVTALNWSGATPAQSSAGIRLTSADNNTASNWVVESAAGRQNPNVLNPNVPLPSTITLTGFSWNYLGNPISTTPRTTLGPWTTPGVYTYVASYTNNCGTFYDTVFVTAASTVPVKMISFNGKANDVNADLMWRTASEKNARLFEVHASIDGKNFEQVGAVKANGNTSVTSTYNFTDVNALANNNKVYYKLKSVDVDGTFEWSNTVIVTAKESNNAKIEVYPNPFNTNVTVSLVDNTPATIEVVTIEGVNVYNATTNSNSSFANINLTQLTTGVYFIKVTQNGNTTVQKLVKQ